jgi:regulator of ribonuclease activity A
MEIAFQTCDLCDAQKANANGELRVLPPVFQHYGGLEKFAGTVATIKCFEDNTLVKQILDTPGDGRVLVVDGGGSLRRALVGGNLATAAARNAWAGILVFGCVRDVLELRATSVGVLALGLMPMPTEKRGEGQLGLAIEVAGIRVSEGDWLYADADGVVISKAPLHA